MLQMFISRKIYPAILKHAKSKSNTVLTGMRRTGKTTIVKQLMTDLPNKNALFLDLERLDNREIFAQKNYETIREALVSRGLTDGQPMLVLLDEVQYAPEAASVIKYLSDHHAIKFVVTGSSSFYLKNVFGESLAGRKKIFELYPLDFGEYLEFRGIKARVGKWRDSQFDRAEYARLTKYYEDYVRYGGFPQVVLASRREEKQDYLSDIISSYINQDIRTVADLSDERNLYNLIKLLPARIGSRVEVSKLAAVSGLARQTVKNYLELLEKTYLIATVPVHTGSADREIAKARKLYFADTGLANQLAEIGSGAQFENTLFNQLRRQGEVSYYALKGGQEADFVYEGKVMLEAKERPIASDVRQLTSLAKRAGVGTWRLVGRYQSPRFADYVWGGAIR